MEDKRENCPDLISRLRDFLKREAAARKHGKLVRLCDALEPKTAELLSRTAEEWQRHSVQCILDCVHKARGALDQYRVEDAENMMVKATLYWNSYQRKLGKRRTREGASKGGKHSKRRSAIHEAIREYLRAHPAASNLKVWDSFPEGREEADSAVGGSLRYSVFRDGSKLYQVDSGGKIDRLRSVNRRTFERYMTAARKNNKNISSPTTQ